MADAVQCPFCRLHIIMKPETYTVYHESPQCEQFTAKMQEIGMQAKKVQWAAVVFKSKCPG